jgi:hypothetical protein
VGRGIAMMVRNMRIMVIARDVEGGGLSIEFIYKFTLFASCTLIADASQVPPKCLALYLGVAAKGVVHKKTTVGR